MRGVGITPRYSGCRFDPRSPLTPHERTLHADTARTCTLCVHAGQVPEARVFCTRQPCASDPGNEAVVSAHGMGSGLRD